KQIPEKEEQMNSIVKINKIRQLMNNCKKQTEKKSLCKTENLHDEQQELNVKYYCCSEEDKNIFDLKNNIAGSED